MLHLTKRLIQAHSIQKQYKEPNLGDIDLRTKHIEVKIRILRNHAGRLTHTEYHMQMLLKDLQGSIYLRTHNLESRGGRVVYLFGLLSQPLAIKLWYVENEQQKLASELAKQKYQQILIAVTNFLFKTGWKMGDLRHRRVSRYQ